MTPLRARSPRGERALGKVPRCRGVVTTIIGALTTAGLAALMTIEGGTSGPVFSAYAKDVLAPTLRPGNVVVLDNLAAHRVADVRQAVEAAGARLMFLPPYSPELNPIEESWSKVKEDLRKQEPRTTEQIDTSLVEAAKRVTASDAVGWIQHAGYQLNR